MKRSLIFTSLGCLFALAAGPLSAQTGQPLLSDTVGSGLNESYLVIDFENGTLNAPDASYAFGYRYDLPANGSPITALDMIQALTTPALNTGLTDTTTTYSFGTAVDSFSYNGLTQGGFQNNGYWNDWTSTDGQNWTSASSAPDFIDLTNGTYNGWTWNGTSNYPGPAPIVPLIQSPAVPEAGTGWLLLLGLPLICAARRRVRH